MINFTNKLKMLYSSADYVVHVESLREKYSIRVEIDSHAQRPRPDHKSIYNKIKKYLDLRISKDKWEFQSSNAYANYHWVWFMDKEDALAFMLQFDGKIV